jgi:hypothetical protein
MATFDEKSLRRDGLFFGIFMLLTLLFLGPVFYLLFLSIL